MVLLLQLITVQEEEMGVRQSVQIDTPAINLDQWQEIQEQSYPEEYGVFRTLRNKKTGEKIDEYDFIWPNEQEYHYYLKSFNWRHTEPNVVNTKFIILNNHEEICSHTYTAKIYIEHIKIRISQISDIPYPDNLYVLMESLEGFQKIFLHSKYFLIQENQICVDQHGNVKIWVNSDLSVNYPNNDGYIDYKQKEEEDMVDAIVNIIAENTDEETQPSPSFRKFYEQKRGPRGKKFEQAKVLVLNYARLNDTEIPSRFQAIINLDNEEQLELKSFSDNSKSNHYPQKQQQTYGETEDRNSVEFYNNANYQIPQSYSFGPHNSPVLPPLRQPNHHYLPQQPILYPHPHYQQPIYHQGHQAPVYFIPHYARIEYPPRNPNPIANHTQVYSFPNHPAASPAFAPQPQQLIASPQQMLPPFGHNVNHNFNNNEQFYQEQSNFNHENIRATVVSKMNESDQDRNQESYDRYEQKQRLASKGNQDRNQKNSSLHQHNQSISEGDDLVARSLPIKAGYPSQNNQKLSSMGESQRPTYSHINPPTDQRQANLNGFGLTKNSQLLLKDSALSNKNNKSIIKAKPIKYFYSLDQQFQIDADIAADMAKYLP